MNVVVCPSGGAGVIATLIHDGFMNPVDGELPSSFTLLINLSVSALPLPLSLSQL